jgi:LacI family transcriptional regulator
MGYIAGKVLWQLLSGKNVRKRVTILQTDIVLRETVKERNASDRRLTEKVEVVS